jgi:16S rRNA (guanine1207-N2)-methyltransferase
MPQADRLALALETGGLTLPGQGGVLVLRANPSAFLAAVPAGRLACEQSFRPPYDSLEASGLPVFRLAEGPASMVVVNLTRSRAENLGAVARALATLPEGGVLAINGAKTEGVDSVVRQVGAVLPIAGTFVKAHGRVVWLERPARLPEVVARWAAEAAPSRNSEGFVTAPGLFSPERADPGSRLLAGVLAGRLHGRVADFGAGWGWLAHEALARCPGIATLDLYEAEARALEAARLNVNDPRAGFHWTDVARLGPGVAPYDAVIANPPFHLGRAADPGLGRAFIAVAARILKPGGRLVMVANRQLPYEAECAIRFAVQERLAEDRAFKVIAASRPVRERPGRG